MTSRPGHITVVICTYNRSELLRAALTSMMQLRTDGRFTFDVLVVDNGSTDDTQSVVAEMTEVSPVPMRGVLESTPGVAAARNRGLAEACGEWIAFCDDDQRADPNWLIELLDLARTRQARVVGGAVRLDLPPAAPLPPLVVRRSFGESVGNQIHRYSKKVSPGTGNLLVHRSVVDQVGTFDVNLREAGEDTDLFRRIREAGIEAWYTPRAIVWHYTPLYRLERDYQRWSAHRTGWVFADRDQKEHGLARLLLIAAARASQAATMRLPQLVWSKLRGDRSESLGAACYLWRCEGYLRRTFNAALPRVWPQTAFRQHIEFRAERSAFDSMGTEGKLVCGTASPSPALVELRTEKVHL